MNQDSIFRSLTDPIPALRSDVEIFPVNSDGEELLAMNDPAGYAEEIVLFKPGAWELFRLFDGTRSINQLQSDIREATGQTIDSGQLLSIIQTLDRNLFLFSIHYRERQAEIEAAFRASPLRPAAHAGSSYPADPEELRAFLGEMEAASTLAVPAEEPIGVLAPHIDLRVGGEVYIPAYRALRGTRADTIIILGFSHYSDEDLFILTEKDFETPLGIVETDREFVRALRARCDFSLTKNDFAHAREHSIEFQAVFLRHFPHTRGKKIVPILCTHFEEFLRDERRPDASERFTGFVRALQETIRALKRRPVYIMSVDWSHVGRKFGDAEPAAQLLPEIRVSDLEQLEAVRAVDYAKFFDRLARTQNATRIDAFSCFSTFFFAARPRRGALLDYRQWHEEERASGVTFASIAFYA